MSGYEPLLRPLVYPVPPVTVPPAPPPLEERTLALPDGTPIVAWWQVAPVAERSGGSSGPSAPTSAGSRTRPAVLYLHGNGENLETMRQAGLFAALGTLGTDVLALDYPGYGRSRGRPDEQTLAAAARAGLDELGVLAPGQPAVVMGFSLGAAVALALAAEVGRGLAGLALFAPWTRLAELAAVHVPGWVAWAIPGWIYDSLDAAGRVAVPSLVVHGEADEIIPVEQGRRVFARLPRGSRLVTLPARGHNDLLAAAEGWQALADYLAALPGDATDVS
jgi:pimeloyl-ACP methyl ester carboxylesterase